MASRRRRLCDERCGEALLAASAAAPDAAVAEAGPVEPRRGRIGGRTIPRRFVFLAAFARSAMGRILDTELRQRYDGSSAVEAPVN